MKVKIHNIDSCIIRNNDATFPAIQVSVDPKRQYAVVEISPQKFLALHITSWDDRLLTGEYVDHFFWDDDTPELRSFTVDWNYIQYGFCKLILWAPERRNENGGQSAHTVKRFYFDRELYKERYEEINGIACKKQ